MTMAKTNAKYQVIPEKIEKLQKGICPIYEPGAEVQLSDGLSSGQIGRAHV